MREAYPPLLSSQWLTVGLSVFNDNWLKPAFRNPHHSSHPTPCSATPFHPTKSHPTPYP